MANDSREEKKREEESILKEAEDLINSETFVNESAKLTGFTSLEVSKKLSTFVSEAKLKEAEYSSIKDFKQHFINTLKLHAKEKPKDYVKRSSDFDSYEAYQLYLDTIYPNRQ